MTQQIRVIDAFGDAPFTGNPAAVCIMDAFPEAALMQKIAMEMNLSETAFAVARGALEYDLRWFTPVQEVTLCGHATLATAHALRETGAVLEDQTVTFYTLSGVLTARILPESIELDFPSLPGKVATPHPVLDTLGVPLLGCQRNRDNYLVEVADYDTLLICAPDFRQLAQLDMQGVIVTTATGVPDHDFASRYFATPCGVDEDPVCGSAHCFLAPYWAEKLGKTAFRALQASKRTGILEVALQADRVRIAGRAVTTLTGQLTVALCPVEKEMAA